MLLEVPKQLMRRGAEGRHLGKYPMKQSTGPTDVSIRACSTAPRGVAMAIRFMQRNLARPLTTGEIAAAAGASERWFYQGSRQNRRDKQYGDNCGGPVVIMCRA